MRSLGLIISLRLVTTRLLIVATVLVGFLWSFAGFQPEENLLAEQGGWMLPAVKENSLKNNPLPRWSSHHCLGVSCT